MFTHQSHLRHLLRPEHYHFEEHYRAELRNVFLPAWHPVATKQQLRQPGDFITCQLFGHPILLRNMDGELCAFLNVCPHRHARLTNLEKGHSERLRCQYHGWEYNRDGHTGRIPDAQAFRPWDRENSCLRKFRVETWGEVIFVCLQPHGPSLRAFLSPIPELWGQAFEPPFRFAAAYSADFDCNWKVVLENSLESYHIPEVHPKTFKTMPEADVCSHVLDERYTTFTSAIPNDWMTRAMNWIVRRLGQPVTKTYEHQNVHPHITFSRMDVYRLIQAVYPTSPTTCRYSSFLFSLRGRRRGPLSWLLYRLLRPAVVHTAKKVFGEDASIYTAVQHGMKSSPYPGVIGTREERIYYFQKYILDRCGDLERPSDMQHTEQPLCETVWGDKGDGQTQRVHNGETVPLKG
jgi:phenylpropionate dioxygenase-like ring-hydroxylating dioxygenase large terminal subunit